MILLRSFFWLLAALALATVASTQAITVEDFTRYAEFETVNISPDGTYLAVTQRQGNVERLMVLERKTLKPKIATSFGDDISISNIIWSGERYILVQPAVRVPGITDYHVSTGEIGVIDLKTGRSELIFGYRAGKKQTGTHIKQRKNTDAAAVVLDTLPDDPNRVLIQTLGYGARGDYNELLKLDVRSGKKIQIARSPLRNGYFAPSTTQSLVAGLNVEGRYEVHTREEGGDYSKIYTSSSAGEERTPLSVGAQPGYFLFSDSAAGKTRGIISWNPRENKIDELFRHDEVDYESSMMTPQGELWGVRYHDHFPKYSYPNPDHPLAKVHARLVKIFPNMDVNITSITNDQKLGVVHVSGPSLPGSFIVTDLENFKFLSRLDARSWLEDVQLAEVMPFEFAARDGVKVRGLLTMPPGENKNLPAVVMVHGGPHGVYDRWGFNWQAQMLAAKGFAVLQINYRGSGGRGLEFRSQGYGRWGREMQDDVTDGVKFAIGNGTVDPKRICIYGGSYGGYAALTGAYRDPEFYRCAVGLAGVYDLELMFEAGDIRRTLSGVNYLKMAVGDNKDDLRSRSPVHNASKIKIPVLLVHGKRDVRVPIKHAERMRRALQKSGNKPQWHVEDREAHGIFGDENRVVVYQKIVDFFSKHLALPAS